MIRALLDGKTQTRRLFVPPPPFAAGDDIEVQMATGEIKSKYAVGDRLWVRETFATDGPVVRYYATDDVHELRKKKSPIHMPRWASRLTLTVTDVRVQRLLEISEADAWAEGVAFHTRDGSRYTGEGKSHFCRLWESIHGAGSWAENPWIVALTFTVARENIDAQPKPEAA